MIRRSRLLPFFLFLLVIASNFRKTNQVADKDISTGIDRVLSGNRMANKFPIKRGGGSGHGGGGHSGGGGRGGGGGLIGRGGSANQGGGSTDGGYRSSTEGGGIAGRSIPCKAAACGGGNYFPRHKSGSNSRRSCGGVAAVIAAAMFSTWLM